MTYRQVTFFNSVGIHVLLIAISGAAYAAQGKEIRAVYKLGGQPTGTYRESESRDAAGETLTTIDSKMIFNRLGTKLRLSGLTQYREHGLQFVGFQSDQSSSQQTVHVSAVIKGGSIEISTSTGGETYARKVDYHGDLLGPAGARNLVVSHLRHVGDMVSYQTFSPDLGLLTTVTAKLIRVDGDRDRRLTMEQTFSAMPGKSVVCLDKDVWLLSQTTPSPFGEISAERAANDAMEPSAGASLPSETFAKSIVNSNIRLPDERLIDELKIEIRLKKPELGWPDLRAPNQRVLSQTHDRTILQISRPMLGKGCGRPESIGPDMAGFLKPNALLQPDDAGVRSIASKVVRPTDDAWAAARALQKWTNENMHFDLGIAVAPASEVAKNRGGTCFGYSMLLGSLARASGVPSRVRMGLVYAGGIWGGHAWVDVLIGKQWIPIDAALYAPGPADAARFSCYTSSLEENSVAGIGGLAKLLGNVDISILEYTVAGKRIHVPNHAKSYSLSKDIYRNPWLGISVRKPRGFQFFDMEEVWPSTTIVGVEGPKRLRVKIENLSASLPTDGGVVSAFSTFGPAHRLTGLGSSKRQAYVAGSKTKFAVLFKGAGSCWMIHGDGPGARAAALEICKGIEFRFE